MPFSLQLQKSIEKLGNIVIELDRSIQSLEDVAEKFEALFDLSSLTLRDSNLSVNISIPDISSVNENSRDLQLEVLHTLCKCYRKQTELNHTVAENIGTSISLEHTVYYTCIWSHQPAVGNDCFIAEKQLGLMIHM